MKNINWDEVGELNSLPTPGGYAARIIKVDDDEDREFLKITWDFADGEFKGSNQECFDQRGFWPMAFIKSYKPTALKFFKAFKTAVEKSNPGYEFKNSPQSLVNKYMGVVLGEEEYIANDGNVKTRLYVDQIRSGEAIRNGDFKIPELKRLKQDPAASKFAPLPDTDDGDLPF